jgi:hypothetical protein
MSNFLLTASILLICISALAFNNRPYQDSNSIHTQSLEESIISEETKAIAQKKMSFITGNVHKAITNISDRIGFSSCVAKKEITFSGLKDSSSSLFFADFSSFESTIDLGPLSPHEQIDKKTTLEFKSFYDYFAKTVSFFNVMLSANSHFTKYTDVEYYGCVINNLIQYRDEYSTISFLGCNFNLKHYQIDCSISNGIYFEQCSLPDTIVFPSYSNIKGDVYIDPSNDGKIVKLWIGKGFPIQNLKVNLSSFELLFDSRLNDAEIESIYRTIIQIQKEIGSQKDIECAEIALKDYLANRGDVFLGFQKFLWNYGYDKILLLERLFFCFIFFYIMNLFLFRKLIHQVYPIANLKLEYDNLSHFKNRKAKYYRFPLIAFLYSSIIFFGWKMDFDKFKFNHLLLSFYVILFYLIGLGLLFYAIGLLLNKG